MRGKRPGDVGEHRQRRRREVVVAEVVLGDPEGVEAELAGDVASDSSCAMRSWSSSVSARWRRCPAGTWRSRPSWRRFLEMDWPLSYFYRDGWRRQLAPAAPDPQRQRVRGDGRAARACRPARPRAAGRAAAVGARPRDAARRFAGDDPRGGAGAAAGGHGGDAPRPERRLLRDRPRLARLRAAGAADRAVAGRRPARRPRLPLGGGARSGRTRRRAGRPRGRRATSALLAGELAASHDGPYRALDARFHLAVAELAGRRPWPPPSPTPRPGWPR